jgi:hypothetical protein
MWKNALACCAGKLRLSAVVTNGSLQKGVRHNFSVRSTVLLFFFAVLCGSAAGGPRPKVQNAFVVPIGPPSSFAVADFDGDGHPDIAHVESGRVDSSLTDYWIRIQLTTSEPQLIRLVAPAGGLRIEARDVNNGNHFVDLVLATALFGQPVAILINDGRGRFAQVAPTAFPDAFTDSKTDWTSTRSQEIETTGGSPQSRGWMCSKARRLLGLRPQSDLVSPANPGFVFGSLLIFYAGRAPPLQPFLPLS